MNRQLYFLIFTLVFGLLSSCDVNDPILVPADIAYVAFTNSKMSTIETSKTISIELYLTTLSTQKAEFTISSNTQGLTSPAKEGTDFSISGSNKVVFDKGFGRTTITVNIIDNDVFTGAKEFYLEITSGTEGYKLGIDGKQKILITIQDNEHPLKALLGRYRAVASNWWGPEYDLNSDQVLFQPDPANLSNILISNITSADPALSHPLVGAVNTTKQIITIKPQRWSDSKTNGYYFGFNLGTTAGVAANDNPKPIEESMVLTYTISGSTVTITGFNNWGVKWMDPQGAYDGWWWWDYFTSGSFTKLEGF